MRRLLRIVLIVVIVLLVLVVLGAGGGYWFASRAFPQIDGTLHVAGLKSTVQVVRDPRGVPHLYADNLDDLFFATGYVQAQDRLWQMEFNRRVGYGTLSEVFGAATIKEDRFLRTMGLGRAARADWAALSAEEKHPLDMFASGVNAFLNTHQHSLPLEFTILGFKPAPWQGVDTLAWAKVVAYDLGGNYDSEIERAELAAKVGLDEATQVLMPPYPTAGPFIIPPEAKQYSTNNEPIGQLANYPISTTALSIGSPDLTALAAMERRLGLGGVDVGSNNWVVDGTKTTTGKPLLANDPHLAIQMPSIWYEMGMHCVPQTDACPLNVVGFTFPSFPVIVIGHNDRIAWGVTNVGPDVQDLYMEKVNPANPNQYEYQGKWEDMQVVDEPIKVNGVVSETLHVQITRHGPIMTPVLTGASQPLALQWTALRERSRIFQAGLLIDQAKNWDDFRNALKLWDVPSQNFIYADVDGNIGYQMPGNVPIRAKGDGSVPQPGWTGEYEWKGSIPFDELPFVFNPPTHFIATANNAVVPMTYKYLITNDWSAPFREQRITELLKAKDKLSIDDIKRIQGDVYSIPLAQFQPYVAKLQPKGTPQQRALDLVKAWDGIETEDSAAATVMAATLEQLVRQVFYGALGEGNLGKTYLQDTANNRRAILALLEQPDSKWWQPSGRDATLASAFTQAVDGLARQYGDNPAEWRWGRIHTATFDHPLGSVRPLNLLFNAGPVGVPGGVDTVFATPYDPTAPYAVSWLSSMRQIVDLSNLGGWLWVNTTGQSGLPLDKHFSDMVPLWRSVQYVPMLFDRAALDQAHEGILILQP